MSGPTIVQAQIVDTAALPARTVTAGGNYAPLMVDTSGRLVVNISGTATFAGATTPGAAMANPSDCVDVAAFNLLWSGAAWARQRSIPTSTVAYVASSDPAALTASLGQALDLVTGATWRPLASYIPTDAIPNSSFGIGQLMTLAFNALFDGSSWRRARGDSNGAARAVVDAPAATGSTGCATPYTSGGAVRSAVIKASEGKILSLQFFDSDLDGYLCLVDKATAPVNGDAIVFAFAMDVIDTEPLTKRELIGRDFFGDAGIRFANGIAWAWSSTRTTITLATPAAAFAINATYV